MSEENGARMRAESRVVEVEKQCSMLEFDLKQSVQKMEQLMKQKERLEDEACRRWIFFFLSLLDVCSFYPSSLPLSSSGEGPSDTDRAGVEQARAGLDWPEEPHAGGGPPQVYGEAAQTGNQHGTRE